MTGTKLLMRRRQDCIDQLRVDHMKVEAMLLQLRLMRDPSSRKALFAEIRDAIDRHMRLEEDLFYPACERIRSMKEIIERGRGDHELVKGVLKDLESMKPDSKAYDSLLTKLILRLERHVMVEENQVFPEAKSVMSRADFESLDQAMQMERRDLEESQGASKKAA